MVRDPCKNCLVKPCCRSGCVLFIEYRDKFQKFMSKFTFSLATGVISLAIIIITISALLAGSEAKETYAKLMRYSSGVMILVVAINSFFNYYLFAKINKKIETRFER